MITLECRLVPPKKPVPADLSTADETALHYDLFLGDLVFSVDGQDFSAKWGWTPLADFLGCLLAILRKLETEGGVERFEFTESDAKLSFAKTADGVLIRSNYAPGEAKVPLPELKKAVAAEAARLRDELLRRHPSLSRNPVFKELLP